jgi:hypothetical protein
MVKEKLRKALEDAVKNYNEGMSADAAIVAAAKEHDLTIDQVDRVVESFNTAKAINYYEKTTGDRTGGFDLADKKGVTLALFGKENSTAKPKEEKVTEKSEKKEEKTAEAVYSDAFYTTAPDTSLNRKSLFKEKRASYLDRLAKQAEERRAHGYSDATLADMASDAYSTIKSAEADAMSAVGTIDSYLNDAIIKIAEGITRVGYGFQNDRADMFKAACPHKRVINAVSKACPILKAASGGKYAKMAVVDTTPVDGLLAEADEMNKAMDKRAEFIEKAEMFRKRAELVKSAMLKDPSMRGVVKQASAARNATENFIHRPKTPYTKPIEKKAQASFADGLLALQPNTRAIVSKGAKTIANHERSALLADLMSSDPIIQEADPRQVSAVYKSIIMSSPKLSLNKEVVRSVLRQAVNSIALSPADSQTLAKIEESMAKSNALVNKVREGE